MTSRGHCKQTIGHKQMTFLHSIFLKIECKMVVGVFWLIKKRHLPGVMMRDKPDTEADFGTLPVGDLGFSGVSSW